MVRMEATAFESRRVKCFSKWLLPSHPSITVTVALWSTIPTPSAVHSSPIWSCLPLEHGARNRTFGTSGPPPQPNDRSKLPMIRETRLDSTRIEFSIKPPYSNRNNPALSRQYEKKRIGGKHTRRWKSEYGERICRNRRVRRTVDRSKRDYEDSNARPRACTPVPHAPLFAPTTT